MQEGDGSIFISSRIPHKRNWRDWSSDVCSSDLPGRHPGQLAGKSPYLQAVQIEDSTHRVGHVVRVRITRAGSNSLFGERDRKSVVQGKSVDLGGRRIIKIRRSTSTSRPRYLINS